MINKHVGKFSIPLCFIRKNAEEVAKIISKLEFIPMTCENFWHMDMITYTGISRFFPEATEFGEIEEFFVEVYKDESGKIIKAGFTHVYPALPDFWYMPVLVKK